MADPAIAAAALQRTASTEAQNGNDRREHGGKRQRTDDTAAPNTHTSSISLSAHQPTATSPPPVNSEASVTAIADFIESLSDYEPTIPDDVVSSILRTTGCDIDDPRLSDTQHSTAQHNTQHHLTSQLVSTDSLTRRILSRADTLSCCLRFIFNVAEDAQQVSRLRTRQADESERSNELTMDDLTVALSYQGIQVSKPAYYADHLETPER